MAEAFITQSNTSQSFPKEEIINLSGSFTQSYYDSSPQTLWTPSFGTPYRVYVTTAKIIGNFSDDFGPIDCTGESRSASAGSCTLRVSLAAITIQNVQTNVTVPYEITGVAYYDA